MLLVDSFGEASKEVFPLGGVEGSRLGSKESGFRF